jgi:hypothetical protein
MQSILSLDLQMARDHQERRRVLNQTLERVVNRVLGCWQHDLSRPFSNGGRTYRVCLKCGMSRDFDATSWKTYGHYHRNGPQLRHAGGQTVRGAV